MIGLDTLVYFVVFMLCGALILGLLWWLIGYIESKVPSAPFVFTVIRVVFVILVVLLLIGILLTFAGYPVIRMPPQRF